MAMMVSDTPRSGAEHMLVRDLSKTVADEKQLQGRYSILVEVFQSIIRVN